jgi:Immunoglobulin-like domain of bacterial spore germination/Sporulation and spore germination
MNDDDWVRTTLTEAVQDIEPDHAALSRIHERTRTTSGHRWLVPTAAAAGLVLAGTVTAVALTRPDQAGRHGPTVQPTSTAPRTRALPVYLVGDTPQGPRLYRQFEQLTGPLAAVDATVRGLGSDPDYRTLWSGAGAKSVGFESAVIAVDLEGNVPATRPPGMTAFQARLAIQQIVYTAQGALASSEPVVFRSGQTPLFQLFGVNVADAVPRAPQLKVLSLVNITDPAQGASVGGGVLKATGLANSFEANVPWKILRGTTVVRQGAVTADGAYGSKLYPWRLTLDVSKLAAGTYTLLVQTDDPSGGEGPGPMQDTRTFKIG